MRWCFQRGDEFFSKQVRSRDTPVTTIVLDVLGSVVQYIHLVANPEKLLGVRAIETS